jgi:hypothetical protein
MKRAMEKKEKELCKVSKRMEGSHACRQASKHNAVAGHEPGNVLRETLERL